MNNNLKRIEKELRGFAKRCKDVKYNAALLFSFLVTGSLSLSEGKADGTETVKKELKTSVTDMKKLSREAKTENNRLMKSSNLELVQLMEQGDHVVKSPWNSWQFGMNYFYNNGKGTYKGKGDKKDKYPYEGILARDTNLFNRFVPVTSDNYSTLATSSDPTSASSNSRNGMKSYGIASTRLALEPPVEISINAGISPKNVNKTPLNIMGKVANAVTLPESVKFSPISPEIPSINSPNVNIKDITLSTLWNTDKPANSQYAYFTATKVIKPGFTYNLNTDYGSGITGYNKIKTFSAAEVVKTSDGIDYTTIPQYNAQYGTTRGGMRDYTYGAIFEFIFGEYTLEDLTIEVDEVKDRNGNIIRGTRAISTDGSSGVKVHNKSNIKLSADGAVGFATDEDDGGAGKLRQMTNEKEGLIYATGKGNVAFILVKEQDNPEATHEHINNGKIIMDGDEAYAYAFSKTNGVNPNKYITHNVNNGEIVMAGNEN